MKKTIFMIAAICCVCCAFTNCTSNKNDAKNQQGVEEADLLPKPDFTQLEGKPWTAAIYQYLADSIGIHYGQGEEGLPTVCLPAISEIATDESDPANIKVWGDYWVYNYERVNDSLRFVSGGNHPGLIYLSKEGEKYVVTKFDQVADGAENLPSAKRIFGDKFAAYQKLNSDKQVRDQQQNKIITKYAKKYKLKLKGME